MSEVKKFFGIALDPIHIGAGGYRLRGVDNTIVREPATNVPKIPGTSFAGVVRRFYTIHLMENDCKNKSSDEEKRKCAEEKASKIFGDETQKGILRFYDGQIVFFPVSSVQGTVWITTKEVIEYWLGEVQSVNGEKIKIPDKFDDMAYAIKGIDKNKPLNLGWLLLEIVDITNGKEIMIPPQLKEFLKRIVIVSDKLFSHIVNDNLEVRTSVRIDPETGAATERALFTYEAIPRGTILGFEIAVDRTLENMRLKRKKESESGTSSDEASTEQSNIKIDVEEIIKSVDPYLKNLGIGGMGTRGFGRLKILFNNPKNTSIGGDPNAQS